MRISCDQCHTTYVLEDQLVGPGGSQVQCTRCSHTFTARLPGSPPPGAAPLLIGCQQCGTTFSLEAGAVPQGGANVQCSRCAHAFWFSPGGPPPRDVMMFGAPHRGGEEVYRSAHGRRIFGLPPAPPPPERSGMQTMVFGAGVTTAPVAPRPRRQPTLIDSLYQQVWASPDDDAPRGVLSDYLSELGDPRGELIAIQLAEPGGATGLSKGRAKQLKRHYPEWLPPGVEPRSAVFRRGFLHECRWTGETDPSHREWRTVERLECGGDYFYRGTLFAGEALTRLRELRQADAVAFAALSGRHARLEVLHTLLLPLGDLLSRVGSVLSLPALHTLVPEGTEFTDDGLAHLFKDLELRTRPLHLRIEDAPERLQLDRALEGLGAIPAVTLSIHGEAAECWLELGQGTVRVRFRKTAPVEASRQLVERARREGLTAVEVQA